MVFLNKKIDFNSIFYTSIPGFLSIVLTLISIPIYLNNLSTQIYSSYIISHIFLSLSLFLNLNIGKISSIYLQNKNLIFQKKIISTTLFLSVSISVLLSLITLIILYFLFSNNSELNFHHIFFGLFISIIFINIEYLNKGLKKFKIIAISNFFFYGFSLSGPALLLLLRSTSEINNNDLFFTSLIIKFFSLILIMFIIFNKISFKLMLNKETLGIFKNQSVWMTLTNFYNQIFDYLDKYLIKFFLSPVIFINYTIAQQVASKLTIFSGAIISVCLPSFSAQKIYMNKKKMLNLYYFLFYLPISILIILFHNFFDEILTWWLGENFNQNFLKLFYLFLSLTFVACMSHIIISFYEANYLAKKNALIETVILIPFIFFLIYFIVNKNIIFVCYLILFKEILLLIIRFSLIKSFFISKFFYFLSLFLFLLVLLFNVNGIKIPYYFIEILFFFSIIKLISDLHKNFYPKL